MTNTIKRFAKTLIVTFIALQLVLPQAFAFENIKLHSLTESKEEIIQKENNKSMLIQEWYGLRFQVGTSVKSTKAAKTVKISEYQKAFEQVKFNIEKIGSYDVYFLDTQLTDYSNVMALSFMDDTAVVFGTTKYMTKTKIHRLAIHELGHQVDFSLMNEDKWSEYKEIRGIENGNKYNNNSSIYVDRPQEIFAEDFRIILGGSYAAKTAHMNKTLENPNSNKELVEFFNELVK